MAIGSDVISFLSIFLNLDAIRSMFRSRSKNFIFRVVLSFVLLAGVYFYLKSSWHLGLGPAMASKSSLEGSTTKPLELSTSSLQPSVAAGSSEESCQHTSDSFRCVKFLSNYDGDTLTVGIPGVHPLLGEKISVRVLGIDTPEKTGTKPCEKQKARDAQRLVENLLRHAQRIDLLNVDRDKYFRILAHVRFDGKDLSQILLRNALAVPYTGGRKPASLDWCRQKSRLGGDVEGL